MLDKYRKPFESAHLKSLLGECDRYGVDYRTPANLTPLMLAAEIGNLPLIEALLERGADITQTDLFGRTPYLLALNRALGEADFAAGPFGGIDEQLRPPALDVLVSDRLVRLAPDGAKFYFLSVLLATLPHFHSQLLEPPTVPAELVKRQHGFFADVLLCNLDAMPQRVFKEARRERSYINHVLARAEVESSYLPARRLWKRRSKGFYQLNPEMQVSLKLLPGTDGEWASVLLLADPVARAWLNDPPS